MPSWLSKWRNGKESAFSAGDTGSIPGSGRSPGEDNGNTLQYSCLGNTVDRGALWATVHRAIKSQTQLNDHHFYLQGLELLSSTSVQKAEGPCGYEP